MSKIPRQRRILYTLVNRLEEFYASTVDCLINVSDRLEQTFQRKPKRSVIIMNCAEEYFSDNGGNENMKIGVKEKPSDDLSSKSSNSNNLKLIYTGNIIRGRGIEKIAEAIRGMNNVSLLLAGKVIDYELLQEISSLECVKYFGYLPLNKSLELERSSDVMVILYDPYKINNIYAMRNKLFESMMFGIPLIKYVSRDIIKNANCGLLVHYNEIEEIKKAEITLRDNCELKMRLGRNGRTAFENEFNWQKMEQVLYRTYGSLLIS